VLVELLLGNRSIPSAFGTFWLRTVPLVEAELHRAEHHVKALQDDVLV